MYVYTWKFSITSIQILSRVITRKTLSKICLIFLITSMKVFVPASLWLIFFFYPLTHRRNTSLPSNQTPFSGAQNLRDTVEIKRETWIPRISLTLRHKRWIIPALRAAERFRFRGWIFQCVDRRLYPLYVAYRRFARFIYAAPLSQTTVVRVSITAYMTIRISVQRCNYRRSRLHRGPVYALPRTTFLSRRTRYL